MQVAGHHQDRRPFAHVANVGAAPHAYLVDQVSPAHIRIEQVRSGRVELEQVE